MSAIVIDHIAAHTVADHCADGYIRQPVFIVVNTRGAYHGGGTVPKNLPINIVDRFGHHGGHGKTNGSVTAGHGLIIVIGELKRAKKQMIASGVGSTAPDE